MTCLFQVTGSENGARCGFHQEVVGPMMTVSLVHQRACVAKQDIFDDHRVHSWVRLVMTLFLR